MEVLSIYAHGNTYNVNYYVTTNGIQNMLMNDSAMWQNFKSNGGTLTIDLKSCNTGLFGQKFNISQALTFLNKGITIYAPASYWKYDGTIQNNAGYNKFFDGKRIDSNLNR